MTAGVKKRQMFPLGSYYAPMPIGFLPRMQVRFFEMSERRQVPKYASVLLGLFCEMSQRENGFNTSPEICGVEVSARGLAEKIGAKCYKTVNNTVNWLREMGFLEISQGNSTQRKTVITLNVEAIKTFVSDGKVPDGKPPDWKPDYGYQKAMWEEIIGAPVIV